MVSHGLVPHVASSQYPPSAGTTISNEIVVIREAHSMAKTNAGRSSDGSFTTGGLPIVRAGWRSDRLAFRQAGIRASWESR